MLHVSLILEPKGRFTEHQLQVHVYGISIFGIREIPSRQIKAIRMTVLEKCLPAVADQRGRKGRAPGSKFFQFHAVFGKFWQNRMLAASEGWRPHPGEILDPPLSWVIRCREVFSFC